MKYLKKFGFLVVAMFIMSAAFLTGCGKPDVELPGANDPVIGNGGLTVQKGNYLYYVNGYKILAMFIMAEFTEQNYLLMVKF